MLGVIHCKEVVSAPDKHTRMSTTSRCQVERGEQSACKKVNYSWSWPSTRPLNLHLLPLHQFISAHGEGLGVGCVSNERELLTSLNTHTSQSAPHHNTPGIWATLISVTNSPRCHDNSPTSPQNGKIITFRSEFQIKGGKEDCEVLRVFMGILVVINRRGEVERCKS